MTTRRDKKEQKKALAESESLSDLETLDDFCLGIEYDEVDFEDWCRVHKSLDLEYTLWVSSEQAQRGCVENIQVTRSIKTVKDGQPSESREKSKLRVEISPGTRNGEVIQLEGCGDQDSGQVGHVKVTIRFT